MRVLLISPLPPPVGGIASWTVNILDYYKENPEYDLIHLNTALRHRDITRLDSYSRITAGLKGSKNIILNLLHQIKKYNPDVIHMTSSGSFGLTRDLLILILSKIHNIPVITHFRFGRIPEIKHLNNWEWKLLHKVALLSSSILVLDSKSKQSLLQSGFSKVYTVPNPISKDIEVSIADNSHIIDQVSSIYNEVIFVGHVTKDKGVFELVHACCSVDAVNKLTLIGPYEENIRAQLTNIATLKNLNIEFSGVLDKQSVLSKMRDSALLVLPSYTEGFPNVILESMAMKCPIIATNVGAIPDILDVCTNNPAGEVIKPRDVDALSSAIDRVLSNQSLSTKYSKNAIKKVLEYYTLKNVCSVYENIWKSTINLEVYNNINN